MAEEQDRGLATAVSFLFFFFLTSLLKPHQLALYQAASNNNSNKVYTNNKSLNKRKFIPCSSKSPQEWFSSGREDPFQQCPGEQDSPQLPFHHPQGGAPIITVQSHPPVNKRGKGEQRRHIRCSLVISQGGTFEATIPYNSFVYIPLARTYHMPLFICKGSFDAESLFRTAVCLAKRYLTVGEQKNGYGGGAAKTYSHKHC